MYHIRPRAKEEEPVKFGDDNAFLIFLILILLLLSDDL